MKHVIKSLPLLGRHLASRAIKQLNKQITTLADATTRNYTLEWLHPLSMHDHVVCNSVIHRSKYSHTRST